MVWPCRQGWDRHGKVEYVPARQAWSGMDRYGKAGHRINTGVIHETGT